MNKKKYYVTTPIYYVNFKPHIGTSYTTILTDVLARHRRFHGDDVLLVTGSDEHSQNIADLAQAAGKTPKAYCDEIIPRFTECWDLINIQSYRFERTSSETHHAMVQAFWQRIYERGDVYKGEYSGWYHTTDNRYLDPDEVPENPEKNPKLKHLTEESYYFKLSKYEDWLKVFHDDNPQFVVPDFRRNEMLGRIKEGLKDICISRTSTEWGIPLPWDSGHVFYVWIEALLTYMTGSGFDIDAFAKADAPGDLISQPDSNYWPADLHVMAKDIPWFHAIIWPAMLHSFGAPTPKKLLVHGYWQFEGEKMSKSLGNVVDPYDAAKVVGSDGLRYFLMREVPAGRDGNFNYEALIKRFNFDLANDLGNLVHRTISLIHQLFDGIVPEASEVDEALEKQRQAVIAKTTSAYDELQFSEALQQVWSLVGLANQFIDQKKPWELKKKPERREEVGAAFNQLIQAIHTITLLAYPVIPSAANRFWKILNLDQTLEDLRSDALEKNVPAGHQLGTSEPIFKRVAPDVLKQATQSAKPTVEKSKSNKKNKPDDKSKKEKADAMDETGANTIKIDDFFKVQLLVGEIRVAEKVEKADKLLRLEIFDGQRDRQVVSGIAKFYVPDDLVGKKIILVANLKPAKLRGLMSEGMLLAAENDEGELALVTLDKAMPAGAKVS